MYTFQSYKLSNVYAGENQANLHVLLSTWTS